MQPIQKIQTKINNLLAQNEVLQQEPASRKINSALGNAIMIVGPVLGAIVFPALALLTGNYVLFDFTLASFISSIVAVLASFGS